MEPEGLKPEIIILKNEHLVVEGMCLFTNNPLSKDPWSVIGSIRNVCFLTLFVRGFVDG